MRWADFSFSMHARDENARSHRYGHRLCSRLLIMDHPYGPPGKRTPETTSVSVDVKMLWCWTPCSILVACLPACSAICVMKHSGSLELYHPPSVSPKRPHHSPKSIRKKSESGIQQRIHTSQIIAFPFVEWTTESAWAALAAAWRRVWGGVSLEAACLRATPEASSSPAAPGLTLPTGLGTSPIKAAHCDKAIYFPSASL